MEERDKCRRQIQTASPSEKATLWQKFKRLRNRCVSLIRRDSRRKIQEDIERESSSARGLWKLVNSMGKEADKNQKFELIEDDVHVTNERDVANTLNSFFVDKINIMHSNVDKNTQDDPYKHLIGKKRKEFGLSTVTRDEVMKKIKALKNNNSHGIDGILITIYLSYIVVAKNRGLVL